MLRYAERNPQVEVCTEVLRGRHPILVGEYGTSTGAGGAAGARATGTALTLARPRSPGGASGR